MAAQPPRRRVVQIHRAAPAKPPVGAPCNGCGLCCLAEPCPLGMLVSRRRTGACLALQWDEAGARYRCALVVDPTAVLGPRWRGLSPWIARWARRWIAAGSGCDAEVETDAMKNGA